MTPKVVSVLDSCQISYRKSVHLISAIAESLNVDSNELILNKSSFHVTRQKVRKDLSGKIKILFKDTELNAAVVHWDGKIIPDIVTCKRIDRLPIVVSNDKMEKLINVPALDDGKGATIADAVYKSLYDWGLADSIKALCCDTTASNLGNTNGAAVILQQLLDRDILYLPCRHHIYEIMLANCFELKIPGMSGPNVPLFKRFHDSWEKIDKTKYKCGLMNMTPNLSSKAEEINLFIEKYLNKQLPRDDYQELLLLSKHFLGTSNTEVVFYKPGAYHHARWMAKAIYSLKIYLFRDEFNLTYKEEIGLQAVCLFIVFVYIKNWFSAPIAIRAPVNDLLFIKALYDYKGIDSEVAESVLRKFKNHLWYLTPEICAISLFDKEVSIDIKRKMVEAMQENDEVNNGVPKRLFINKMEDLENLRNKDIDYFINSNSLNLFNRFKINKDFLNLNVEEWSKNYDYLKGLEIFSNLRVVNDAAERGVHLFTDFANVLTKDEEQKQYLLQLVSSYKQEFPNANKETVTKKMKLDS